MYNILYNVYIHIIYIYRDREILREGEWEGRKGYSEFHAVMRLLGN